MAGLTGTGPSSARVQARTGRTFWLIFAIAAISCLSLCPTAAAEVVEVEPAASEIELTSYTTIFEDPEGTYRIQDILAMPVSEFRSLESVTGGPSIGTTESVYWLRIDLRNSSFSYLPRILQYRQSWTSDVQFYVVADGEVASSYITGTHLPFSSRTIKSRYFCFPVELHNGVNTYYFRLQSVYPLILDFRLYQSEAYENSLTTDSMLLWAFYGALIIMIIMNILLFFITRQRTGIVFVFFLLTFLLFLFSFDGTGFQYLWPQNTWWESRAFTVTFIASSTLTLVFFILYTGLREKSQRLYNGLMVMIGLGALGIAYALLAPSQYLLGMLLPFFLLWVAVVLGTGSWLWIRHRERSALFFLASYTVLLAFSIINSLQALGLASEDKYSHIGMHTGIVTVALVLNLGLADRIKQTTLAREEAEKLLRLQYEDLQQVHADLRDAMEQSEALNQELVASREELLDAHERLSRQERRIKTIFDLAPVCMILVDQDGMIVDANRMSSGMFGFSVEELVGMDISCFVVDETAEDVRDKLRAVFDNEISAFNILRAYSSNDGSIHWGATYVSALHDEYNQPSAVIIAISDISDQKYAEDALLSSEQKYRAVVENAGEIIMVVQDQKIKYVNPHIEAVLGWTSEEMQGDSFLEHIHPDDIGLLNEDYQKVMSGSDMGGVIFRAYDREGGMHHLESRALKIDWEDRPANLVFSVDITERVRAVREMTRMQNLLAGLFDAMPSVLVGVSPGGRVNLWNQAAVRMTGVERPDALGQKAIEIMPVMKQFSKELNQSLLNNSMQFIERLLWTVSGEKFYIDTVIYPLNAEETEGVVVRIEDVTEKVRLEEMIVQTEKMLSVGQLAAGMAHEINNPLGGILQGVQNLKRRLSLNLPINFKVAEECGTRMEIINQYMEQRSIFELLDGIRDSGDRAASIIHNMLQFSRLSQSMKEYRNLHQLVERTLKLAASDYDLERKYDFRHIEIKKEFDLEIPDIYCIATEMEQVILNLLKNAAHAVFQHAEHPVITVRTFREGDWIVLNVEDNGPGMSSATMRRVFEPFFTTKETGTGTGLGLSVSYFIITNNHGGQMMVESSPGQGAKFIVKLPVSGSFNVEL